VRRVAILALVLFAVLVGGGGLGFVLFADDGGQADATVETFEPRVAVGNESATLGDSSSGSAEVETCTDRGPLPGYAGIFGEVALERPTGDDGPEGATYNVSVTVADGAITDAITVTLEPGDSWQFRPFNTAEQPDSLSGGDEVIVDLRVTTDGATAATASRTVTVDERSPPCAE